jgi:4-diphosphocytidyl-2-C-methyl-D-erythritol kinase
MVAKSFAKINLGLEVLGQRPDGYHNIRTLFQSISLHDELEFETLPTSDIELEGDDPEVPWDESNLIFKAVRLLRDHSGVTEGVHIRVAKRIPSGRGLAGGSSNAAVALSALSALWRLGLSQSELAELGRGLGADVPFFFTRGLCLGEERGDRITPLPDLPILYGVLVCPPFPIATALIYRNLPSLTSDSKDSKIMRFLETRELGFLENQLEDTIFRLFPQLKEYKSFFRSQGAELSLIAGSGSAVFGLFRDLRAAELALAETKKRGAAVLVETVPRGMDWIEREAGVSPSGKAADFGSAIRGFESSRPSSKKTSQEIDEIRKRS